MQNMRNNGLGEKVELSLDHPLEGRNNPQPSKGFMHWRVPSRFSDPGHSRPSSKSVHTAGRAKSGGSMNNKQHKTTHTTHFSPPLGKFAPIKSEQQEHMEEVHRLQSALAKRKDGHTLPRLSLSANPAAERPIQPRTYSSAQRWLEKNPGKERLAEQVVRQTARGEIDKVLRNTLEPDAREAVRKWLETATESDRKAAIKFFKTTSGSAMLGGPSGHRPAPNVEGGKDARLQAVLDTLETNKGKARPRSNAVRDNIDNDIKALVKAASRKRLRLLSPNTRLHQKEFQTWHHMPVYPFKGRTDNVRSMYTLPNLPPPYDFRIHPEWEY